MRLIGLLVILSLLPSKDMHAAKVHFGGKWENGPQEVLLSYTEDAVTPKVTSLRSSINPASHRFEFVIDVIRPTILQFHNQFIIVLPEDTVNVNVMGNESDVELQFTGRYAMEHNFLVRLKEVMGLFAATNYKINEQTIERFKVSATHHYDSSLLFLTNDIEKYKGRKSFQKVVQGYLTTLYYSDLLYPVAAGLIAKEKLPQYYFELVNFSFFKTADFLGFRSFILAASQYNSFYYTEIPAKNSYDSASVALRIKSANHNFFGEVKDNLLLFIFCGLTKHGSEVNSAQVQTLYEYLTGVFKQETARIEQMQELKHEYEIINKPFPLKTLEQQLRTPKGKTISLAEVLATNEVVYIVFWASWCKTCIDEMSAQKQLMNELQETPVKFIFVSFDDDEKKWQKAIAKIKTKDDHYLIPEGFSSALAQYISFKEIPRYVILDKVGRLISRQAPGPVSMLEDKSDLLTLVK